MFHFVAESLIFLKENTKQSNPVDALTMHHVTLCCSISVHFYHWKLQWYTFIKALLVINCGLQI